MTLFWKIFRWLVIVGSFVGICVFAFSMQYVLRVTKDLPSVKVLSEYKPPVMTRVHAGDGKLITEFKKQARVFVPIETIPRQVQHAFVAAEDQRFYQHDGFDERGFIRAMVANVSHVLNNQRLEGGSTITQQVAKNFFEDDRTIARKIREIVIARRIEKAMDKDHVLELYLNEIYFGRGAYGIAAASLNYFGKPMKDLTLAEAAYLAVLPKAPNNYQVSVPAKRERAMQRRNYVLSRMVEDGYATPEAADAAKDTEIVVTDRLSGEEYLAAEYFVEEARKKIYSMYGEDQLYSGGLSIRTTLDTDMQLAARRALRSGLEAYDRRYGYRGPLTRFDNFNDWKARLEAYEPPKDIGDWRVALVMSVTADTADLRFVVPEPDESAQDIESDSETETEAETEIEQSDTGTLRFAGHQWARPVNRRGEIGANPKALTDILTPGDVILVQAVPETDNEFRLRQIPNVNGGIVALDPHTGRVLALVGGYSFAQSQFNRVTQAQRQPGSAFKPFVYAAALLNGYTPSSQVLDAPFVIERQDVACEDSNGSDVDLRATNEDGQVRTGESEPEECERFYKPSNYAEGRFYGLSTLRLGLEKSRNAMTVRLANDLGMAPVMAIGTAFDIYDEVRPELAFSLGAGETSLMRLAGAYAMLVNGGKKIEPRLLDRVQNAEGETIFVYNDDICLSCQVEEWDGAAPPELEDLREPVIDPVTAYQISYMLQGVVENGTGRSIASLGRPLAGKTGTTNDYLDAWFMGFSPDLVAGVYVGYDTPRSLNGEAGSTVAVPIFKSFMADVLSDKTIAPFRIPEGVTLSPVNRDTGEPSYIGAPGFILEAFKPGTEPRIGQLSSTIRVGSGTDSFVSRPSGGSQGGDNDVPGDRDDDGIDAASQSLEPQPQEDELDDGLY